MAQTPQSASRHQRRFARLLDLATRGARRSWRRMDPAASSWEDNYATKVAPTLVAVTVAAQTASATEADGYTADILNELAFGPRTEAGVLLPRGFAGISGDGRPVTTLLSQSVQHAGERYNALRREAEVDGRALTLARRAIDESEAFVEGVVETILADTVRAAEEAAMAQRPWVAGWVRQAEPGACSRCIILSGKFFLLNEGFLRHPRCRCTHLPAPDGRTATGRQALDRLIAAESPDSHFAALTEAEQDRIFGAAGAQAIRDGADISRVVNARRGMSRAQVFGRDALVTTEATTRRGRRAGQARGPRLMPESILAIAGEDPEERVRLLRLHGYLS